MATQSFILPVMKMWNSGSVNAFRNTSTSLELKPSQRQKDTKERKTPGPLLFNSSKRTKIIYGAL